MTTSSGAADRSRASCRRPIEPDEVAHLEALGRELRSLRHRAGMTQEALGWAAELSRKHISYLERGVRRTRRTTLRRIANVLVDNMADYAGSPADLTAHLAALAGPTVAPESDHAARVQRRRRRRIARADKLAAAAFPLAVEMAREMVRDLEAERIFCAYCFRRRDRLT